MLEKKQNNSDAKQISFVVQSTKLLREDGLHAITIKPLIAELALPGQPTFYPRVSTVVGYYPKELINGAEYSAKVQLITFEYKELITYEYKLLSVPELIVPPTKVALIRLIKAACNGVGTSIATEVVDTLGLDCINSIAEDPAALDQFHIKKAAKKSLTDFCEAATYVTAVYRFCEKYNIPKIYWDVVMYNYEFIDDTNNLYKYLYDLIPFSVLEKIAENTGISEYKLNRIEYVIREAVAINARDSPGFPLSSLRAAVDDLLYDDPYFKNIIYTDEQLENAARKIFVVCEDLPGKPILYDEKAYKLERWLAANVAKILTSGHALVSQSIFSSKDWSKIGINAEKIEAVKTALTNRLSIITGGPGTGKTRTIQALITMALMLKPNLSIRIMAPTASAAKRAASVTHWEASTLHHSLRVNLEGNRMTNDPLPESLLIVDEASMANTKIMAFLLSAMNDDASVVLVGDDAQLPPVGSRNIFETLAYLPMIPHETLKTVFRQKSDSSITSIATVIRDGSDEAIRNIKFGGDCTMTNCSPSETVKNTINSYKRLRQQGIAIEDIMAITPIHEGFGGRRMINADIQKFENPESPSKPELTTDWGETFRLGDRVMNLKNHRATKTINGDIGRLIRITENTVTAQFGNRKRTYSKGGLYKNLTLAYSMSVHKSQGNEAKHVLMVLSPDKRASNMYSNSLLYTGFTRAKETIEIIGPKELFIKGCCHRKNDDSLSLLPLWIDRFMREKLERQRVLEEYAEVYLASHPYD